MNKINSKWNYFRTCCLASFSYTPTNQKQIIWIWLPFYISWKDLKSIFGQIQLPENKIPCINKMVLLISFLIWSYSMLKTQPINIFYRENFSWRNDSYLASLWQWYQITCHTIERQLSSGENEAVYQAWIIVE